MNNHLFFSLVLLCSATHIIRLCYEVLKHKDIIKPDNLTFIIIFTDMALLWCSWFLLCINDILKVDLPVFVRYSGLLLVFAGLAIFLTALFTMKTLESYDGNLITGGIYSKIRHPMYSGFILWLIGFPIYWGAVYSAILAVPFILNILYWRYLEEKELEKRFAGYKEYRLKTLF